MSATVVQGKIVNNEKQGAPTFQPDGRATNFTNGIPH